MDGNEIMREICRIEGELAKGGRTGFEMQNSRKKHLGDVDLRKASMEDLTAYRDHLMELEADGNRGHPGHEQAKDAETYLRCLKDAIVIALETQDAMLEITALDHPWTAEDIRAMASTLFINRVNSGH
jgi:hypothetical protein